MKTWLTRVERKGFIFIQAMTLWSDQDAFKKMAAAESHHAWTGDRKNNQKPCHKPRTNSRRMSWHRLGRTMSAECRAYLVKEHAPPHVRQRNEGHDDERPHEEALSPCLEHQFL